MHRRGLASCLGLIIGIGCLVARADDPCPAETTPQAPYDQECGADVMLDSGPGSPMSHVRVRDQGSTNTCYAYAATEQVDAWRFSHGDTNYDVQGSGVASAIMAATDRNLAQAGAYSGSRDRTASGERTSTEFGANTNVLTVLQNELMVCDSRAVRINGAGTPGTQAADRNFMAEITRQFDAYHAWETQSRRIYDDRANALIASGHEDAAPALRREEYAALARERERRADEITGCMRTRGFEASLLPSRQLLAALFLQTNPLSYLQGLISRACWDDPTHHAATIPPFQFHAGGFAHQPPDRTFRQLRDLLQTQSQPIHVAFCDHIAQHAEHTGLVNHGSGALAGNCGGHSILVIGKRMHCGKCQFQIRNSWGQGCGQYHNSRVASCILPNTQGDVWLNADAFSDNAYCYSYLF